jgi:CDGSH-type Zn-finger protein/uncharacterized Fe-S cluster protein YjdI
MSEIKRPPSREQLIHLLYEAAELEHTLMCTYLYAAFSLRNGDTEALSTTQAEAVARFRRVIVRVAIEEMGHLSAVWNITSALGAAPRFGRGNFPLDPGYLPAGLVVKLAPFDEAALQHFIHLERPDGSSEGEGKGFEGELRFRRGTDRSLLVPMPLDYDTVGAFYDSLGANLRAFVTEHGEEQAFCGDPALQLSQAEVALVGATPVICSKTALAAFTAIVQQGEGAPADATDSHYQRFLAMRSELSALMAVDPHFRPALPAAHNPVLRRPLRPEGRVWIEDERAIATVDLANTGYALMLRLLAYSYLLPRPAPEKSLAIDLALGLMRVVTHLGERAARLPAGPSNPDCNAGMSFTALRDSAALPPGPSALRFFSERFAEMTAAAARLKREGDAQSELVLRLLADLGRRASRALETARAFSLVSPVDNSKAATANGALQPDSGAGEHDIPRAANGAPVPSVVDGVEHIPGKSLTLLYEGKKCIHARFCVTGAPNVFLANVKGPWIVPDAVEPEKLMEIAHACPSGAIRYRRRDGQPDESLPPVNLLAVREAGPYAVRGDIRMDDHAGGSYRATLCRCGASKHKPYCDGSHHEVKFTATGEPATGHADMLAVRDGPLQITPLIDGPLQFRGNLEITSGTGRVVARLLQTRLCRCGASNDKPFCDGSHTRVGFKST